MLPLYVNFTAQVLREVVMPKGKKPLVENGGENPPISIKEFDPKSLTKEQQEEVVKEYLGVHPKYFIYEGLAVKLNFGLYSSEMRNLEKETGKPREWFNGWKPNLRKYHG